MKLLIQSIALILVFSSCTTQETKVEVNYSGEKQFLIIENTKSTSQNKLIATIPDSITTNKKTKIIVSGINSEQQIKRAYFDCNCNIQSLVDTTSFRIDGCTKGLSVINNKIEISFTPSKPGHHDFHEITAVTKDNLGIIRAIKGTFSYTVKE